MNKIGIIADKSTYSHHADIGFVVSMIILLGLGFVTLYVSSANYGQRVFENETYFVKRQLISFAVGFVLFALTSIINFAIIRKILPYFFIATIVLCILTFFPVIGVERNGARRWLQIPFLGTFQPSEIAKIAVVLFLANFFDKKQDKIKGSLVNFAQAIVGLFLVVLIVFLQNDFSTAFFIMLLGFSMFFMAGMKLGWFLSFCVFSLPIVVLFIFTESYRVKRLIAFFNPDLYSHGVNFQINKSRLAISNGHFFGCGLGGEMKTSPSIPSIQSDFIFAGWTEAMGFFGVILFFVLVFYFAYRGYVISFRCKDKFRSYVAFGIVTSLVLQILFNCGVVCGAFPATGIPLPFFSYGGSSLITTLLMCGMVVNISKYDNENLEINYEQ